MKYIILLSFMIPTFLSMTPALAQTVRQLEASAEAKTLTVGRKDPSGSLRKVVLLKNDSLTLHLDIDNLNVLKKLEKETVCNVIFKEYENTEFPEIKGRVLQISAKGKIFYSIHSDSNYYYAPLKIQIITYNASDNPNLCMEAVETGIMIETKSGKNFFSLGNEMAWKLYKTDAGIGLIEIGYYQEPLEESGAVGFIRKIVRGTEIIYQIEN